MLGDQLGESQGKRIVRRVLSADPLTAEVSFEDSGHMLGVATNGTGTYTSVIRPDGSIFGEGQGIHDDPGRRRNHLDPVREWAGLGRAAPSAIVECCTTARLRRDLARLNNVCAVFEYEVDPAGNTSSKVWEWK